VKLLFDENLSPRLVRAVEDLHPGSMHVSDLGLERADDPTVRRHALEHGFTLVTKDADFAEWSLREGPPPKVVWIRRGNCSTRTIESLLRERRSELEAFEADETVPFLSLE
jgi:predicted nuclease of predicted toxin-antitoxin system